MTKMTIADLRQADILLTAGDAFVSRAIRVGTGSQHSHAMLFVGGGVIVDAIGEGVRKLSIGTAMAECTLISVYRHKTLSGTQAKSVARYALRQEALKKKYDRVGAAGAAEASPRVGLIGLLLGPSGVLATQLVHGADVYNRLSPETAFYCSELVALAFDQAGAPLVHKPLSGIGNSSASVLPGEIAQSHVLALQGQLKK